MSNKVIQRIIIALKIIMPMNVFMSYYSSKHSNIFIQLMKKYGALDMYIFDRQFKRDYFRSLGRYGIPLKYYLELEFNDIKDEEERNKFVPPGRLVSIWKGINVGPQKDILDKKNCFMKEFSEYLHRDWLYVPETSFKEFVLFYKKYSNIIAKRNTGAGGAGIYRLEHDVKNEEELHKVFRRCVENDILLEEMVNQDGILHDLNHSSVNCVRICTLRFCDHVEVFQCFLKIGSQGEIVDNIRKGGAFAVINPETGIVDSVSFGELCSDTKRELPSGIDVLGLKIPYWENVKKLVIDASDKIKDIMYVSWDVAISEGGKLYLIEGNSCGNSMWLKRGGEWLKYKKALISNHKYLKYLLTFNYVIKCHTEDIMKFSEL